MPAKEMNVMCPQLFPPAFKRTRVTPSARSALRAALWLPLMLGLSGAFIVRGAAAPNESLPFATSYTIPGGYQVGGVDLLPGAASGGFVTGTIPMSDVPANADIIAAFLLWETIYDGPGPAVGAVAGKFRGNDITVEWTNSINSQDIQASFAPCWTSGGGGGASYTLAVHRADVLQFLPAQPDTIGGATGKRLVNSADLARYGLAPHTVQLPEAGSGNQVPQSAGASLFVVYRDPNPNALLTKVVFYNGLSIGVQGQPMNHTIRGFFDAAPNAVGKMTHIVGSGAPNGNDQVYFNGVPLANGLNRFDHAAGGTSDRAWSNPTFTNLPLTGMVADGLYGDSVTTKVDHGGHDNPNDCLTWSAIIFSTAVQDTDGDGLLDSIESSSGWKEPNDQPLPDIHSMGADPAVKDLFLEMGYMSTSGYVGGQGTVTAHSHRPTPAVLKMVGDALWCGGVAGCTAAGLGTPNPNGVHVHIDAGDSYPLYSGNDSYAERYMIRGSSLARGGEEIAERFCVGTSTQPCRFPAYPGTIGWKIGFQLLRDAPVQSNGAEFVTQTGALDTAAMDACELSGTCRRRFDFSRKDMFHYGLYGHATGIPKSPFPCLTATNVPTAANSAGMCDVNPNPEFTIPSSVSGGGDLPGGDFIVTLGFWDDFVGTEFFLASTTLHELGHNLDRWHGGAPPTFVEVGNPPNVRAQVTVEPNCKPNYPSSMSYLFQLYGLRDNAGVSHIDFSNVSGTGIVETTTQDGYVPSGSYRTSWYAPRVPGTLGFILGTPAAKRYCNGATFPSPLPQGWTDFVRINGTSVGGAIDWNGDQDFADTATQNVNFDASGNGAAAGSITNLDGSTDWGSLRLNQVGARRNMAAFSAGLNWGGLNWSGADGLNQLGLNWSGLAAGTDADDVSGGLNWSGLNWGGLNWSGLNWGGLNWSGLNWGGLNWSGLNWGGDDIDTTNAAAQGFSPPNEPAGTIITGAVCDPMSNLFSPADCHRVRLQWKKPNGGTVGGVSAYHVYRYRQLANGQSTLPVEVTGTVTPLGNGRFEFIDRTELPNNGLFTYYLTADFAATSHTPATTSAPSDLVPVTAINSAPVASIDTGYNTRKNRALTVAAPGVLLNDVDVDSVAANVKAVFVSQQPNVATAGTIVLNANGSFTYTPKNGFGGPFMFTYKVANGTWTDSLGTVPMSADSAPVTDTIVIN